MCLPSVGGAGIRTRIFSRWGGLISRALVFLPHTHALKAKVAHETPPSCHCTRDAAQVKVNGQMGMQNRGPHTCESNSCFCHITKEQRTFRQHLKCRGPASGKGHRAHLLGQAPDHTLSFPPQRVCTHCSFVHHRPHNHPQLLK